jgi:hypothetical protein
VTLSGVPTTIAPTQFRIEQVQAAKVRGRKSYVAVTDAMSQHLRARLTDLLRPHGLEELIFLPESEVLRVAKQLREHMGIDQPQPPAPKSSAPKVTP